VHFSAIQRKRREPLVRYCLWPAIASERLTILKDGSIAYSTKHPRGRRTHRVMLPMEFMARLAAIVPPPCFPMRRYHGVLTSGAPWRKHIVPAAAEPDDDVCSHPASTNSSEPAREGKRARKRTGDLDTPRKPSADTSLAAPVILTCCTKLEQAVLAAEHIPRALRGAAATLLSTSRPGLPQVPRSLAAHRGHPAAGCHRANAAAPGLADCCR